MDEDENDDYESLDDSLDGSVDASLSDPPTFENSFAAAAKKAAEDDGRGNRCEMKTYESRVNSHGERVLLQAGKTSKIFPKTDNDHDAALILVKRYSLDRQLEYTELRVQSPHVKLAMREVIKSYPGLNLNAPRIDIRDEPRCLFHYRNELTKYAMRLQDPVAVEHLHFTMNYMYQSLQTEILSWYLWAESGTDLLPGLEFEHLWMAFRPGCLLYKRIDGSDVIARLEKMQLTDSQFINVMRLWRLTVSLILNDGKEFGRHEREWTISAYHCYLPFTELSVFPLEYHPERKRIYDAAVRRGQKYVDLMGVHYRYCCGQAELLSPFRNKTLLGEEDYHPIRWTTVNTRIVVDSKGFREAHLSQVRYISRKYKSFRVDHELAAQLENDDYATCNHLIPAFSLKDKSWGLFSVDGISEIQYSEDAFDKLILPEGQKELIYSLVQAHSSDHSGFDDIIHGKGKGMIFLLHGMAGVGKTLTAESVAERARQPLYVVGSGDLGVDINSVEEKLSRILRLATNWNAIVLIDEADVFLEKRSATNLKRNGLVSVFLRVLEYYEGILFLTTNRVKRFDKAFKSRIHMAIQFPRLNTLARHELWDTFIRRAISGPTPYWLTEDYLDVLAAEKLNGRQIKNIVRMAHALAVGADIKLERRHLQTSIESMKAFEQVMSNDSDGESQFSASESDTHVQRRPRKRFRGEI